MENRDDETGLTPRVRSVTPLDELEEEDEDSADEVERAWDEEIRRRVARLDAGTAELIPAEQVFAELRAHLREWRQRPSAS